MLQWQATGAYDAAGGRAALEPFLRETLAHLPREHVRGLNSVRAVDVDPKGRALGIYLRDSTGASIEIYLAPHVEDAWHAPEQARAWALRLSLAHTLAHEVGHHQTLYLNRRAEPARKKARVTQTLEKWAEEYVGRRLQKLIDAWLAPGGSASEPEARDGLLAALRYYEKTGRIKLAGMPGTKETDAPSH